jgi:DNA-binding transcriptional MocR family regulator
MLGTPGHVTLEHLTARLFGWQDGPGSLYLRLAEALRVLAETGAVTTGTRLPCERALAAALNFSRNTITAAYRQLRDTGWLIGHQGAAPRVGATTRVLGNDTVPADPLAELFTDVSDPRDAQITRLKQEIQTLKGRVGKRDQTIEELTDFKTQALARLAAQHDEITRLRTTLERQQTVRELHPRTRITGPCS